MVKERILWGIHAGKTGDAEALFEKHEVVALGWPDMGDLNELKTRDEFKRRYEQMYANAKPGAVPVNAGQLYRFAHELKPGDIVVFPLKRTREIWLGEIKGDYQYRLTVDPHYPNIRKVEWHKKLPRTKFSQGALYEIGSAMSFFQIKNFADEFIIALEQKNFESVSIREEEDAISQVADDIEQQSHDFVLKRIGQKLKGHGLAEFAGHLLTLMGYKVKVSPPGPDRGIDITAHKDDLGVVPPTILVQVKSSDSETNEAAVSELYGKVSHQDFGLVIAVGGFNRRARDFGFSKRNLKLIDGDELVELVYKYYDQLDGKYKGMIPLRRVFVPESLTEE